MATVNLGRIKPVWRGSWNSSTQYITDDMVQYNGETWISLSTNANSAPTNGNSNWDLMTAGFTGDASTITTGTLPDAVFPAALPAISGAALTGISQVIKKIHTFSYATRTVPSSSANVDAFNWTPNWTPLNSSNGFLIWSVVPAHTGPTTQDFSGFGMRFNNNQGGVWDFWGRGTQYVENDADALTGGMQSQYFWIGENELSGTSFSVTHRYYTSSSDAILCPNSSDNNRLNQTTAQLMIIEFSNS